MKNVLLTSQSGVLRKVASQTQAPGDYTYEYTKQTEHSQQQTSSGLFQTCFLSCSRPPAFFLFTGYIKCQNSCFSIYLSGQASQFIIQRSLLLTSASLITCMSVCIVFGSGFNGVPGSGSGTRRGKHDPRKRKS
jgi:hypothetical protein